MEMLLPEVSDYETGIIKPKVKIKVVKLKEILIINTWIVDTPFFIHNIVS